MDSLNDLLVKEQGVWDQIKKEKNPLRSKQLLTEHKQLLTKITTELLALKNHFTTIEVVK